MTNHILEPSFIANLNQENDIFEDISESFLYHNEDKVNRDIEIEDLMQDLDLGVVNKTQEFDSKYEKHQFCHLDPKSKSFLDDQDPFSIALADKKMPKVYED